MQNTKKIRTNRRRRRSSRRKFVFLFFIIFCIGLTTLFVFERVIKYKEDGFASENKTAAEAGIVEMSDSNEEEWCLTLVNKWNPMKTDGSEIETVELANGQLVDKRIYPQLQSMFDAARENGVYPIVASGYRTQSKQEQLYKDKIAAYRAEGLSEEEAREEAERWVAIPGTSEHQLGLAVDINADGIHSEGNEVYDWLGKNAHKYGFINRYPSDKTKITGVANEPWHYRYVGVKAASAIYRKGICLEEYLEN